MLLDGAQGIGAIPLDMAALGCDYYAASGQKWLCGPVGSGYLYVHADRIEGLPPIVPGYGSVADPLAALDCPPAVGANRFDTGFPASHQTAWSVAALDVLAAPGIGDVHARAAALAAELADELAAGGDRWRRADRRRSCRGRPATRRRSLRLLGEGFVCATCRAPPTCARRLARGRRTGRSSGWPQRGATS